MTSLLDGSPLSRKIMLSILLAAVFFVSLLTLVVYYANEILEDNLLARQTEFELKNVERLLDKDSDAPLSKYASLSIYLGSRQAWQPVPAYLLELDEGLHHDVKIEDKAYHVLVAPRGDDRIYIQYDITEIERSEELLGLILLIAWLVLIIAMLFIARTLSKRLSGPVAQLSQELSRINPDERGVHLADRFEDDEVGRIAKAFDSYTEKMDSYVEKQMAFAAMASHELRSPLTIVQTSADLIATRQNDPDIKPHLEKIQRAAATMTNMIHALLALTRDQPTRNTDVKVALQSLVDEILDPMQAEIALHEITIENRLSVEDQISADKTLVAVVLTNLIKNGIKHGQRSSIQIAMEGSAMTISDTGIGIDAADLQKIFDFGFRGQNSQGYGVGLYISRLICDYRGWSLDLLPNPDGGIIARIDFSN